MGSLADWRRYMDDGDREQGATWDWLYSSAHASVNQLPTGLCSRLRFLFSFGFDGG